MWRFFNPSLICLLALAPAPGQVTLTYGPAGLTQLEFGGRNWLRDGTFRPGWVGLETAEGTSRPADLKPTAVTPPTADQPLRLTYPWGRVHCRYAVAEDRLTLTIDVLNTGRETIGGLQFQLLEMTFPDTPAGWVEHMPYRAFNLGAPTTIVARCREAVVAACNDDVLRPLLFGFAGRQSTTQRPLILGTTSDWLPQLANPQLRRPIPPGGADRFTVSLRFGGPAATDEALLGDVRAAWREAHPYRLTWPDRRLIGALFLSSSGLGAPRNPRGWFNDKQADFLTDEGRALFREKLLAYADNSLKVLREINAQGMIVWDLEGQEYPHATSYLGDPRSLPAEMEPVAAEFFQRFRDAGFRVGVCLRPQLPVRSAYGAGVRQIEVTDPFATLDAKLAYAREKWGCTLFYVDSNGDPNLPLPAEIFVRLAAKYPDALLMTEHETPWYYAAGAPYRDFANLKQLGTPASVKALYPDAFSCLYIGHGDPAPVREKLFEAVRQGDILVVHGWYGNPNQALCREIYEAARPPQ